MKSLLLIYSDSCPNYRVARQMLEELGLPFAEFNQDNLHKGCWGKNFSSTTLLARFGGDDIIVFGGETNSEQGDCAAILPDKKELKTLLNGLT